MSTVRIISDGTPRNSRVEVDGVTLDCVTRVTFDLDVDDTIATATITVIKPEFDGTFEDWEIVRPVTEDRP